MVWNSRYSRPQPMYRSSYYGGQVGRSSGYARLTQVPEGLLFESSFSRPLVDALKAEIPAEGRMWDAARKAWLVDPKFGSAVAAIAQTHLGVTVNVPTVAAPPAKKQRLIEIHYLGRCKDRAGDEPSAFGHADGSWSVVIPESVLMEYFDPTYQKPTAASGPAPTKAGNYYAVLALKQAPPPTDVEISQAYRRMAMIWHPDKNSDPDAAEQFRNVKVAYDVLKNPVTRKKYEVALRFQSVVTKQSPSMASVKVQRTLKDVSQCYRAPLKCGHVLAEGTESLGRFIVSKIVMWEPIKNGAGEEMNVDWPAGADTFDVRWERP